MPRSSVQDAFRVALKPSGNTTRASVHTLRHRSATHVLEAGVHLRLLQASLGHHTPTTTAISTHRTVQADALARQALTERLRNR
jgi:site-specific recombinase XerD